MCNNASWLGGGAATGLLALTGAGRLSDVTTIERPSWRQRAEHRYH
jgi:hypothetical protein